MFNVIRKIANKRKQSRLNTSHIRPDEPGHHASQAPLAISTDLSKNKHHIQNILGFSPDISYRFFNINLPKGRKCKALIVAVNGLIDEDAIRDSVLTALQGEAKESSEDLFSHIKNRISLRQIEETTNLREGIHQLLTGPPCS